MALGANPSDMIGLILRQGLGMSMAGAAVGVAAASALSRLLEKLLFGVKPLDAVAMLGAPAVLLAVAVLASVIPAWKASNADPAVALRQN
jgi:ABC-type antimicrobial peptide transport system permease subunit